MFDVEKFIQCVEENPAIWDKGIKQYGDRNERDKCWNNVGKSMFDKWKGMSSEEKQEHVQIMKNKWRHIRDNYMKCISQKKSGDPAMKKKKYVYADALKFILQNVDAKGISDNLPDENGDGSEEEEEEDNSKESQSDEAEAVDTRPTKTNSTLVPRQFRTYKPGIVFQKPTVRKSASFTAFQRKYLKKLDASKTEEEDGDKLFLLSLMPYLKQLNDDEKLDFRLYALQFFRDIRQKTSTQTNTYLTSSSPYTNYQFEPTMDISFNQSHSPSNACSTSLPDPPKTSIHSDGSL